MSEVVIVHNPMPFPLFSKSEGRKKMARKRKRRKHSNKGRRGGRRKMYNRRKRGGRRKMHSRKRKCGGRKRRMGAYASFAKSMWKKHKGHYKKIGFKRAGKAIGAAWRAKKK